MTTELEKQFFDTFGIEPKILNGCKFERCLNINKGIINCIKEECPHYYKDKFEYPPITVRILLELICVLTKSKAMLPIICSENTQDLKDEILWDLIKAQIQFKKDIKHQVQELFK